MGSHSRPRGRFRRRLFALASAGSLLLFATACVLWVSSYWRTGGVTVVRWSVRPTPGRAWSVDLASERGVTRVDWACADLMPGVPPDQREFWKSLNEPGGFVEGRWEPIAGAASPPKRPSFAWRYAVVPRPDMTITAVNAGAPYWAIAPGFAVLPAAWGVRRWRRFRRFTAGQCVKCGYDLRATPERCPECGAAAGAAR